MCVKGSQKSPVYQIGEYFSDNGLDLPYEMWQAILRYLPKAVQWRIRILNRMVYEVVMDEAFKRMRVVSLGELETEKNIRSLKSPTITKRVQFLTIHNQLLLFPPPHAKSSAQKEEPVRGTYAEWFKRCKSGQVRDGYAQRTQYPPEDLFHSFSKLDNLHSVEVISAREDWHPQSAEWSSYTIGLRHLRSSLYVSRATIIRLSLCLPLSAFAVLLEGASSPGHRETNSDRDGALVLPNLEDLTFEFYKPPVHDSVQDVMGPLFDRIIPNFVFRHTGLKALTIRVHPSKDRLAPCIPLSPLFSSLSSYPVKLRRFQSFSITNPVFSLGMMDYNSVVAPELAALAEFLGEYADQLTSLQLDLQAHQNNRSLYSTKSTYDFLPPPSTWFSNALFMCPFTCLKTLDLSLLFYQFPGTTDTIPKALAGYLRPLAARGLKVLRIRDYTFGTLDEVKTLLSAFGSKREESLTEFGITTRYLSLPLLDLLAERLGALEVLSLTFETFVPEEGVSADELPRQMGYFQYLSRFSELLQSRSYVVQWPKLRLLRLTSYGYVDQLSAYRSALARVLPSRVRYVIGDDEIVDAQEWIGAVGLQAADVW